ncbi:protein kinase-like domain-containing protein [Artemisia annua]|uniref:Protein kinase-like domain-containing protein n=1 Tax=Artemisia annua TaxID=35608 RepID=A0A2U1PTD5_ARTAN|nr:protein kinase-like domain-containing protein [Artemisia annua]
MFFVCMVVSIIGNEEKKNLIEVLLKLQETEHEYYKDEVIKGLMQLTNWKSNAGDPCAESWKGVTCEGTAVVSIQLANLGIDGTLGYMLSSLASLKTLDLSGNNIHDALPYQLPPNLTSLNLANNKLSGNIPYSVALMYNLNYMNLSRNVIAQNIGDIFNNLTSLTTLDLSNNNLTGDLPSSLSSLSSISTFHVQNNQLTGPLNSLAGLPLNDVNIANNRFSGWIPKELLSVPAFVRSPPSGTHKGSDAPSSNGSSGKKLGIGAILGISLGSAFFIALIALVLLLFCRKGKRNEHVTRPSTVNPPFNGEKVNAEMQEQRVVPTASIVDLKVPPTENSTFERGKSGSTKRVKSPITTSSYTVATLQTATNSFSQDNIIGEGSLGRVYRADFPNAKNIGDIFNNLTSLTTLDLSNNNLTGDLPSSLSSLSSISTFHVQNNQLTGPLNSLAGLPLNDVNIANNRFSGWIPKELLSVPAFVRSPPSGTHKGSDAPSSNGSSGKKLGIGAILGISLGSAFFIALIALVLLLFCRKGKRNEHVTRPSTVNPPFNGEKVNAEMQEQRVVPTASIVDLKVPPTENSTFERGKSGSTKRVKSPITTSSYTVATLQTATNSFSQDNIIGEGSLGRVYRADFPNAKVMAVKKIDNAALSLQEEDNFVEAVSNMSRLRHPNIVPLAGYCAEHGQRLLVYEYIANGSLQDLLHYVDDRSKTLTWNARVRVALGTARALESSFIGRYLHEVCLPSVVHRNLKSANILLDEELNPHLSDCGLAALTPNTEREFVQISTGSDTVDR